MKRNNCFLTPAFAACAVLALATCRNPLLSVGLGDKIDITRPGITLIDSDGVQNGAYVHGTITIKGKSSDDLGVSSVSWTVTDTKSGESSQPALATLDAAKINWSFQLNTAQAGALYKDGEKGFVFTVTDGAGKTTETRMLLIFDNGAPVAMVNLPSSEADPLNGTVRLSGEAYDPFGVQSVSVKLFNTSTGGSPLNGTSGVTADGTNTWNYSFDSTTLTTGTGDFWFQVTVEDRAGNKSAHQYLYSEVFTANANKQFTIDKLSLLESGAVASYDSIDASELPPPGLQNERQVMHIDQTSDNPSFIISSPLPADIVGFNSRVVGLVNDDDGVMIGVDKIKVHVKKADDSIDFGWGNAVPSGSGYSVRFSYALNMISTSGYYKLQVQATDIYGTTSTSSEVIFTVDAGIPAVSINSVARVYFNEHETLHLSGTAQSIGGQVNKVEVSVGATKVLASLASPDMEDTTWTCDFGLTGITEAPTPNKTLVAEATDSHLGAPKVGSTNMFLIIDNTPPQARFVSPSNGSTVYNQVSLRGTSSDNSSLTKVELRIGKAGTGSGDGFTEITGSLYDWVKDFLSNDYALLAQSTDRGDGTWDLPIYSRVYDIAGNVSTNEPSSGPLYPTALAALYGSALSFDPTKVPAFSLVIDLDRDKPTITIQTPRDATNVAGTVVASGSCYDENPGMDKVEIAIAALEDDNDLIGYVTPDGASVAAPGWITVPWVGGQRSYWQDNLNENEKLYSVTAAGGAYFGSGFTHAGKLRVSVRPTDLGGKVGVAQTVNFRLDDTIPRLEAPKLTLNGSDVAALDYLYARGTIRLKAKARDNQQVTSVKISLDGGSSYGSEQISGSYVTPAPPSDYFDIDYPINTLSDSQIPESIRTAKNGLLTIGVKVQDNATPAPYVNTWFVTLNMDNKFPTGSYTGTGGNGHDPMLLSGNKTSSSQVMGTSSDAGAVSGIDKVEVYLVRGADVLRLSDGNHLLAGSGTFGDPPASAPYTTNSAYKAAIDWTKVGPVDNMALVQNGSDVDWWVKLDTTAIPDGSVDIHFVTWDKAGNAVHGMQAGFIRNHVPLISSVTVGTDLDASAVVEADEKSPYNPASPITARNNLLYLKINTTETGYNTPFTYSIKNTTPGDAAEYSDASGVATINTAAKFGGDGDGKVFTVKITDAVGIVVQQTVTVNIHNTDVTVPTITVSPISAPADLLDWTPAAVAGHIESIAISRYDNGGTADADVSGTVMVRGTAHDNVRIDAITLSIDGAGAFQVAHWGVTGLVADVPEFHLSSDALSDSGHDAAWDYKWTSASIAATAKNNVVLSFTATDHSSNPSAAGTRQYDVVPYITQIDTAITGYISKDFNRSALGRYPVRAGETITIKGYNLKPATTGVGVGASDVRVVRAADRDTISKTGRGLAFGGVGSPYSSMTATISTLAADASIGSGYLLVWVGGVPSINGLSARSNSETNFVSASGTDERWLTIWDLTVFKTTYSGAAPNANHAAYPSMKMNGNTPVFAYVNNVQGYGLAEYWNGAAEWKIYENWDLFTHTALDLNSSGSHAALYDINVVQNGAVNWPDDKGGILTTYYYQPPDTTWNGTSYFYRDYHIWLDNLFKSGVSAILGRYQYPDLKVVGDNALSKVFYSVYDTINDQVLVRAFNVGTNSGSVGSTNKVTDTATNLYTNIAQQNQNGTWPAYTDVQTNNRRFGGGGTNAGISPSNAYVVATGAGPWTAVAATSGGTALVVWYDTATNALKYAYNTTPSVSGAGSFIGTTTLDTFCGGDFVDMVVDSGSHVHIAYHDSYSGDLKYIYIDTYSAAPSAPYVVDSYLTVGNKASITVSAGNTPYITYKGMGNTAKAAWLVGARGDGVDANDKFNGTWEVQVMPARIVDNDTNRFNIGVDSSSLPVVGYTNDGIEYIRRLADLP